MSLDLHMRMSLPSSSVAAAAALAGDAASMPSSHAQCWKAIEALMRTVEHLQQEVTLMRENDGGGVGRGGGVGGQSQSPSSHTQTQHMSGGGGKGGGNPNSPFSSPLRRVSNTNGGASVAAAAAAAKEKGKDKELHDLKQIILRLDCEHGDMMQITQAVRELQVLLQLTVVRTKTNFIVYNIQFA
jgi:hypothetical protein